MDKLIVMKNIMKFRKSKQEDKPSAGKADAVKTVQVSDTTMLNRSGKAGYQKSSSKKTIHVKP